MIGQRRQAQGIEEMRRGVSAGGAQDGDGFDDGHRRPHTGRPHTAGTSVGQEPRTRLKSPYMSTPGSLSALSMTPRDPAGTHGVDLEGQVASLASRAVYQSRPTGKVYRPLRARSSYERGSVGSPNRNAVGGEHVRPESARRLRSARPRMQSGDDDSIAGGAYEDKGSSLPSLLSQGVAAWGAGGRATPPQPTMLDPSPRRRSTLPPTPVPADSWAGQRTVPAGAGAADGGLRRGQMLRELAPVITAIAGLTHETNLGKLVRQVLPRGSQILQEKSFNLKLSGDEVYYTA